MQESRGQRSRIGLRGFAVEGLLGEGGMGVVYRAVHRSTGTPVAVKLIAGRPDEAAVRRFSDEVQAHAMLAHPRIVSLYEYGEVDEATAAEASLSSAVGAPFVVMELAERGTLADYEVHDWPTARRVIVQVLDALAHAHARGVIHRDLKPANLLMFDGEERESVKLSDFGIAHALSTVAQKDPDALSSFSGTPLYMPPEQVLGRWRDYGPWTDLYALACIVWQVVCGAPPFSGDSAVAVGMQHCTSARPTFRPRLDVPAELEPWLSRAMSIEPEARFRRAAEALGALPRAEGTSGRSIVSALSAAPTPTEPRTTLLLDEGVNAGAASAPREEGVASRVPAPPRDWRERTSGESPTITGAGLGLFGLRDTPLVGRDAERDTLWDAFWRSSRGAFSLVVLCGEAGVGKSALAMWLARRAHEAGSAEVVRAPQSDAAAGLRATFEETFRTWLLSREEVYERVSTHLPKLPGSDHDREADARAVTELLRPLELLDATVEGPRYVFSDSRHRHNVVARVLRRLAQRRPVVLWIDDLHASSDAEAFVEHLLQMDEPPEVCVVATLRTDLASSRTTARLEEASSSGRCDRVFVGPLGESENRAMVRRLLTVDESTAALVAERSEGNPLFGVQLVTHWIERGVLSAVGSVLEFDARGVDELPDGIHSLWMARVRRFLDAFDAPVVVGEALEVAAALGVEIREDEWRASCEAAGIDPPRRLWHTAIDRGLARRTKGGVRLVHGMFVRSLVRRSQEAGRYERHHAACALALAATIAHDPIEGPWRVARHWLEADAPREALPHLDVAVATWMERSEPRALRDAVALRARVLDATAARADDPRRLDNEFRRAHLGLMTGEPPEEVLQTIDELIERTDGRGAELQAGLWRTASACRDRLGDHAGATRCSERALEFARRHDRRTEALAWSDLAWVKLAGGQRDAAREGFVSAVAIAEASREWRVRAHALTGLGWTSMVGGEEAAARSSFEEALAEATRHGLRGIEGDVLAGLGELARFGGEYERAIGFYARYSAIMSELGMAMDEAVAALNRAMAELGAGRVEDARQSADTAAAGLAAIGVRVYDPIIELVRLAIAARSAEWAAFDATFRVIEGAWSDDQRLEKDAPWLLELAGDVARAAGEDARAHRAWRLARELWATLRDDESVARLDRSIASTFAP